MGWGEVESESFLDGILKGPGKQLVCVAWQSLESYPGALTSPGSPHCAQKTVQNVRGKVRVNPTWVKTLGFHQTAHIYKFCCENWTAHIEICWESESWNEKQKHNLNLKHKLNRNKTKQMLQGKWKWDTYYIYKFCCELWTAHVVLLRYWTGVKCIDNKLTNNTGHLRTG